MVIDAILASLFNDHYLIFLSMVHEYAYFYEYIRKSVYSHRCVVGHFVKCGNQKSYAKFFHNVSVA